MTEREKLIAEAIEGKVYKYRVERLQKELFQTRVMLFFGTVGFIIMAVYAYIKTH